MDSFLAFLTSIHQLVGIYGLSPWWTGLPGVLESGCESGAASDHSKDSLVEQRGMGAETH